MPKNALASGQINPFGQSHQHLADFRRGSFQAVKWRMSSSAKSLTAGLTLEGLTPRRFTNLTIAHQSVELGVLDPKILTTHIAASETFGVNLIRTASFAFKLAPGFDSRPFDSRFNWLWFGAATKGAIVGAARFERTGDFSFSLGGLGLNRII